VIEAGFAPPRAGDLGVRRSMESLAAQRSPTLCRTRRDGSRRGRRSPRDEAVAIHIFSRRAIHMEEEVGLNPREVAEQQLGGRIRRGRVDAVEFSCEGTRRLGPNRNSSARVPRVISRRGGRGESPDTVGFAMPNTSTRRSFHGSGAMPRVERVALSAHCTTTRPRRGEFARRDS